VTAPTGRLSRRLGGPTVPPADESPRASGRPVGDWAFLSLTVTSLGGPLALAALNAPQLVGDAGASAGLAMLAAAAVFLAPLAIWVKYSRHAAGSGGLYTFVERAAGRRVALVQAAVWVFSYVLYLIYTTVAIVYDTLPQVLPGVAPYRPLLEVAIPVALVAVMLAGRAVTLLVVGILAAGQLALVAALDAVTLAHSAPAAASFGTRAPAGALATASAGTALLYICGSLPLFLGGELARPARTVSRMLPLGYLLAVLGIVLAVYPLSSNPAFLEAPIPGVSVAQVFAGHGLAVAVGVGVAASTAGVMLAEYFALSRLLTVVTSWPRRRIVAWLGVALVTAAPVSLIDPDCFYNDLLKPSLGALWVSQAIVFAVYPRFAVRHGSGRVLAYAVAGAATALCVYGLWNTLHSPGT
jgi:amino acid transporter